MRNAQEVLKACRDNFKKLEEGDEYCTKIWNKFEDLSLKEFNRIYDILDVDFDMDLKLDFPKNLHMRFFNKEDLIQEGTLEVENENLNVDTVKAPALAPVAKSNIKPIETTLAPIASSTNTAEQNKIEKNNEALNSPKNAPLPGQY